MLLRFWIKLSYGPDLEQNSSTQYVSSIEFHSGTLLGVQLELLPDLCHFKIIEASELPQTLNKVLDTSQEYQDALNHNSAVPQQRLLDILYRHYDFLSILLTEMVILSIYNVM